MKLVRKKVCFIPNGAKFVVYEDQATDPNKHYTLHAEGAEKGYRPGASNGWYSWHGDVTATRPETAKIYRPHLSSHVYHIIDDEEPEHTKGNTMSTNNMAALMREDAKTIRVIFHGSSKEYTYVTHLPVKQGDYAVVDVAGEYKVVSVISVDAELSISPQDNRVYNWVIAIFNTHEYEENEVRNREIEQLISKAQRINMRNSFAANILATIADEDRARIQAVIGTTKTIED